jgi:hypothetical protein
VEAIAARERALYGTGGDVAKELLRLREDADRETYYRLLPGYVRQFLQNAAPLVGIDIEGNLDGRFALRSARRGAIDPLLSALEAYPAAQRDRLSVVRPQDHDEAIWVHPGEPVFERFRTLVADKLGDQARRGAISVDPGSQKPYLFHLALISVERKGDPADQEQQRAKTEETAMSLAWTFEESSGAIVQDVHTPELARAAGLPENPGFDLLSARPDGSKRSIEVKGLAGTGQVEVSKRADEVPRSDRTWRRERAAPKGLADQVNELLEGVKDGFRVQ